MLQQIGFPLPMRLHTLRHYHGYTGFEFDLSGYQRIAEGIG